MNFTEFVAMSDITKCIDTSYVFQIILLTFNIFNIRISYLSKSCA